MSDLGIESECSAFIVTFIAGAPSYSITSKSVPAFFGSAASYAERSSALILISGDISAL